MKRFLLVLLIAAAVLLTVLFFVRRGGIPAHSTAARLLPPDTALFLQVPDTVRSGEDWHKTDLYALYQEPTVQEFLAKMKLQASRQDGIIDLWREAGSLRVRDLFVATTTFDQLRLVGGFEFRCNRSEAEKLVETWKSRLTTKAPGAQRTHIEYEKHPLDVITGDLNIASTFVGTRFFAASTVDDLKALLDRIDGRDKRPALETDQDFRSAMRQMPADYAWILYLQPKQLAHKLITSRRQGARLLPANGQTMLERLRAFSYAMSFEGGKIRETNFAVLPLQSEEKLTRQTLSAASEDTFLYLAFIFDLAQQLQVVEQADPADASISGKVNNSLSAAGVTPQDWKRAFGNEVSILADWPGRARMPGVVATLAIHDKARSERIVNAITASSGWQSAAGNNADYYTAPGDGRLTGMKPTLAVGDRLAVFGFDRDSIDRVLEQNSGASSLRATTRFKAAAKLVGDPEQMFVYLDLARLYSRFDATVRPLLQMSAAFMPGLTEHMDPGKLPKAEIITRHLSPVIASQSYVDGGYRSESIGTITIGQSVGVAAAAWIGAMVLKNDARALIPGSRPIPAPNPSSPAPSPSPSL